MIRLRRESVVLALVDAQEKLMAAMHGREELVRRIVQLLRGCRALDIPMLCTEQTPEKIGPTICEAARVLNGGGAVFKNTFSCAREPAFIERLEASGRAQVALAGIESHVCVFQTALDLAEQDFDVVVIADAVGSRREGDLALSLHALRQAGIPLYSVEMFLFALLGSAADPAFREILRIVK